MDGTLERIPKLETWLAKLFKLIETPVSHRREAPPRRRPQHLRSNWIGKTPDTDRVRRSSFPVFRFGTSFPRAFGPCSGGLESCVI